MPLKARYYNFCYARELAHPSPALTVRQWEDVLQRTDALRSKWRGLPTGMAAGMSGLAGAAAATYLLNDAISLVFPENEVGVVGFLISLLLLACLLSSLAHRAICLVPWRLVLNRRQMRRAATELGYARVCVPCGYDLRRGGEQQPLHCPECGSLEDTAPPVIERPAMRSVFVYMFTWAALGWLVFMWAILV